MPVVLVAEDKSDIRELLKLLLEKEGCAVIEAADGQEAIEQARKNQPDLVLMDLAMPEVDGLAAARQIRRTGSLVPIIAVTAHPDKMHEAIAAGCTACLAKPVSSSQVRKLLESYGLS